MNSTIKRVLFSLTIIFCFSLSLSAQKNTINDVRKVNLRNSGAIFKDKEVAGYYLFYKVDKLDRKTNSYLLQILDQNLGQITQKKITDTKYLILLEGTFNGNAIMLKFYDTKERLVKYKMYASDGKLITSKTVELTKMEAALMLGPGFNEDETQKNDVHAIENVGFVSYTATKGKGNGYGIKMFRDTKGNGEKSWKKSSNVNEKGFKLASFLTHSDDVLLSTLITKKNLMTRDMDYSILGHDILTGKTLFDTKLEDKKYQIQLMNGYQDKDGTFTLIGNYFDIDAKMAKAKSLGIVALNIDKAGKLSNKRFVPWNDASKFVDSDEKGRIKGLGHIYFHRFIQTSDGKIYGIGESYKKAASGAGIAAAALGGRASLAKMVIEDLLIFEFSSNFELTDVNIYDKGKSSFGLPEGGGLASPHLLALMMKAYGAFDYSFTQEAKDGSYFIVGYVDYKRIKGEKNRSKFGAISNVDGEFSIDEIDLKSEASNLSVLPAKNGHIMITEYFKKEKKIEMRIEKINF